jgi:hypothetical protein
MVRDGDAGSRGEAREHGLPRTDVVPIGAGRELRDPDRAVLVHGIRLGAGATERTARREEAFQPVRRRADRLARWALELARGVCQ